jgi:hypothetical protein
MSSQPTAQIRYELTLDDLIAFNLFTFRNSPTIRSLQVRNTLITSPIVFVIALALGMVVPHHNHWYPLVVAGLSTGSLGAYYAYYFKRGYIKRCSDHVRKIYAEGSNPGLIGEHVLEVDSEGIVSRTQYSESRLAWGALTKVENEPGFTYLFTGANRAITIPHNSIVEGSLPALLQVVRANYHADAKLIA